jgi:hypothetical protein
MRGLRVLLVVPLFATGAGVASVHPVAQPTSTQSASAQAAQARTKSTHCHGLRHRDVRGAEPRYTRKKLATFPNSKRLCRGLWLPSPRRYFVPQGVVVAGNTAWISGFRFRKGQGRRPCQMVRINLVTGRRLGFHSSIYGRVGERPRTYCRHGGGIIRRGRWLWIVEKNKLWQIDPAARGSSVTAHRVWRIKSPVRGSAVVAKAHRVGLVPFKTSGVARIYWFSFSQLRRRGTRDLAVEPNGKKQIGAVESTRIPHYVQGAAFSPSRRLYLARSTLTCGELVSLSGRRLAFIPGAEGIQFSSRRGRRLWTVSESGAWPYARSRKPLTPATSSFEWPRLLRSKLGQCHFPVR